MKQIFSVLSIIVLSAFMTISCSSDDKNVKESSEDKQKDFEYEYYINHGHFKNKKIAMVVSCLDKKAQRITIPSKVIYDGEEYEVMFIREGAFKGCDNLTSIILPDSMRSVSCSVFGECYDKIEEIHVPDNFMDESGLDCLINLQRFLVSDKNERYSVIDGVLFNKAKDMICRFPKGRGGAYSIPNSVNLINVKAFENCTKLTSIDIPGSVKCINDFAFYKCKGLNNINMSDGVEKIGHRAFDCIVNCEKLYIPKSVRDIGSYAFDHIEKLKEFIVSEDNMHYSSENGVLFNKNKTELIRCPQGKTDTYTIPNSVEYLTKGAFSSCSLDSINLPSNLEFREIGRGVFMFCEKLSSISIPEGVIAIDNMAFLGCEKLVSVNLPNSLEIIGEESFAQCNSLEQIYIPANVREIDPIAFYSDNIKKFIVSEDNETYSSTDDGMLLNKSKTKLLNIPSAKRVCYVPAYIKEIVASGDLLDSFVVSEENENYSSIDGVLFDKMKKVLIKCPPKKAGCYTIPDSVCKISEYAFDHNSELKSITIPASVSSIEKQAIYFCEKLEAVNVSENNKHYSSENGVLFNKRKTKMIKYPEAKKGVCKLPESTESVDFANGRYNFDSIVIPERICHLGEYKTLVWCDSLKSITIKAEKFTEEVNEIFRSVNADKVTIYVPEACIENYKQRAKGFNHITSVPLKIKAIGKKW